MNEREPVLQLWHISKRFGAIQALVDVEFEVYTGEVVGLVGDNGAGKSTLIKIIAGVHRPDSGEYRFNGRQVSVGSPREATRLGIETVYQDLALCDNLDVVANLFLGREQVHTIVPGLVRTIDEIGMEREALHVMGDLRIHIPSVRARVETFSGGQRQSVAVARAVMWNSRIVLLDEPTAALGVEQTRF